MMDVRFLKDGGVVKGVIGLSGNYRYIWGKNS